MFFAGGINLLLFKVADITFLLIFLAYQLFEHLILKIVFSQSYTKKTTKKKEKKKEKKMLRTAKINFHEKNKPCTSR